MNAPDPTLDVEAANDIRTSPRSTGTKKMLEDSSWIRPNDCDQA
jgi:hypothetical protein